MKTVLRHFGNAYRAIAAVALFLSVIVISTYAAKNIRIDLTEYSLYTLSDGAKELVRKIRFPVNIYLFFSEKASQNYPNLRNYHLRVREVLGEFQAESDGKIRLFFIDPEPFSVNEDRAAQFGLAPVPLGQTGGSIYFGIAATNEFSGVEVLRLLDPAQENFLEYEISKLIYSLTVHDKPRIGVLTGLPFGAPVIGQGLLGGKTWVILEQLKQLFDVRHLPLTVRRIDDDISVLVVIHPKKLTQNTLYAIDQFVMRTGKAIFFVDAFAEADPISALDRQSVTDPIRGLRLHSSQANELFRKWGFEVTEEKVLADEGNALLVARGDGSVPTPLLFLAGYNQANMDSEDPVSARLENVNVAYASEILPVPSQGSTGISVIPLIWSSHYSEMVELERIMLADSSGILEKSFKSDDKPHTIAARIQGYFNSAFDAPQAFKDEENDAGTTEYDAQPHMERTAKIGNLVVVGDVDILSDRLWVQKRSFLGQNLLSPFASNRQFVINLVDNMTGSNDLISIRSRTSFRRPFLYVDQIEDQAKRTYQKTEDKLRQDLADTERRLQEMQNVRSDGASLILTKQQKNEIDNIRKEMIDTRKRLRDVTHQLVKDIESLGGKLKAINIAVPPVFVAGIGVLVFWTRRKKHLTTKDRKG